jgi:hypothetical protein
VWGPWFSVHASGAADGATEELVEIPLEERELLTGLSFFPLVDRREGSGSFGAGCLLM